MSRRSANQWQPILSAFDQLQAAGMPFQYADVARIAACGTALAAKACATRVAAIAERLLAEPIANDLQFQRWRSEFVQVRPFLYATNKRGKLVEKWILMHVEQIHRKGDVPTISRVQKASGSQSRLVATVTAKWALEMGVKLRTRKKPGVVKREIEQAFWRRFHLNVPFSRNDLADDLGCSRNLVSNLVQSFVRQVADRLMDQAVTSEREYQQWRTEFLTLRNFLCNSKRKKELVHKWVSVHIDHLVRSGRRPTFYAVRDVTGSSAPLVSAVLAHRVDQNGAVSFFPAKRGTKRALVQEAFDRMCKAGQPFAQKDVAAEVGCSGALVSMYTREIVQQMADSLIAEEIVTDECYESWRTQFLTLRSFLIHTSRKEELWMKWVRVHIDYIHRAGRLPTYTEVHQLCGSRDTHIKKALKRWSKDLGIPLEHAMVWKPVSIESLLKRVDSDLHRLPLTFLEDEEHGRQFTDRQRRMVSNIRSQDLRNTAFFVMAFADANRQNDLTFFTQLDSMMAELGIADYAMVGDSFYEDYHRGRTLPDHSDAKRGRFLQTYFRLLRRQRDYLGKLTSDQRSTLAAHVLREIPEPDFWRRSKLLRNANEKRKAKRKAAVAVVHSKFYQLREVCERRMVLVDRLHKAVLRGMAAARAGASLPLDITLDEEILSPGRSSEACQFRLKLWNGLSLRAAHQGPAADRYYNSIGDDDEHPSLSSETFHLTYDDTEERSPRYWFSPLLAAGLSRRDRDLNSLGMSRTAFNSLPRATIPQPQIAWIRSLRASMDVEFIPIDLCMTCALLGNAAMQVMTKTGARANEFMQIRLSREHLTPAKLPNGAEVISFHAIPKGRTQEEPFYIDDRCLRALHAWWKYRSSVGYVFEEVAPCRALEQKLKRAAYLWQLDGSHLGHIQINAAITFLLFDVPLHNVDGSKVPITSHLLRHSFATEMRALNVPIDVLALLMKQRDASVTEYYAQATPPMLIELQRRIFESKVDLTRTHRRSAGQIQRQVDNALQTVGALAPVVGGTCTVANACPAAFACLGCFGNAPDPAKRSQVVEYRGHYLKMAEFAEERSLPHEARKAMDLVSNCDDMLAEMDLIEKVDLAEGVPLSISLVDAFGNRHEA